MYGAPKQMDLALGRQARDDGMALAAARRSTVLDLARRFARQVAMAREDRTCTADDVRVCLAEVGLDEALGNAAGSVFRTPDWRFTGHWVASCSVGNHARHIRVWRLVS